MSLEHPAVTTPAFLGLSEWDQTGQVYGQLLDAAPDAVVVVDAEGRVLFANVQTERMFDYARGALLGKSVEVLLPDRMRMAHVQHRSRFVHAPRVRPMGSELQLSGRKRSGSEFPIEISLSPLTTEKGMLFSASIRDITKRKQDELELQRARALAEKASSAKSEFLASMSHELRTPLNAVLGFAQLLQRDKKAPLSARQQERVEHVLRGGEHLLRLIDDVLDLARIEAGRILVSLEQVGLVEVLTEVKATLDPMAARANMRIRLEAPPVEAAHVVADRTRLKQILMNYGSNAIKYGRPGGTVTFLASTRGGAVRMIVVDDGMGIAPDKQGTIFQPFQRAGQEAGPIEGTGIGLVISKRLAELMGGTVGFESTEGVGSRFWIEMPQQARNAAPEADPARPAKSESALLAGSDGPRYLVIYVEDNPSNIAFMQDLLGDFERVELITAPTAEIGVELIRSRQPDVVIMDINLPGMSGFEATRQLKEWPETRDIPIVALSAAAMIRDAARVSGAGFYRYLTKPVKVDELAATLEELLARAPRHSREYDTSPNQL